MYGKKKIRVWTETVRVCMEDRTGMNVLDRVGAKAGNATYLGGWQWPDAANDHASRYPLHSR
jgi:hypothetical protein